MKTAFVNIIPVLPSADVERDTAWYKEKMGFECLYKDTMSEGQRTGYAVLGRNNQSSICNGMPIRKMIPYWVVLSSEFL